MSDRTTVRNAWSICLVVALGLLLNLHDLSPRPQHTLAQPQGPGVVLLALLEDNVATGRYAVLAMTLDPRVRIVAGSLALVRAGTKDPRPLTGTATHFHEPQCAIMSCTPRCEAPRARWTRRSCQ
jgi:hypothetical protein